MINTLNLIEAALFAANGPLSVDALKKIACPNLTLGEIRSLLSELEAHYATRGIQLTQVASGYRFQIPPEINAELTPLTEEKPSRFSKAFMETLALIAYRQPITRGEIEDVRGVVVSSNIIKTLTELDWIRTIGHKDVPGKPALYATTKTFLDFFNLKKLEDLPPLSELVNLDLKDLNEMTLDIADKSQCLDSLESSGSEDSELLVESSESSESPESLELPESPELNLKEPEHAV